MKLSPSKQNILDWQLVGFLLHTLIVFDYYKADSIKNSKRRGRGKSNEMIVLDKISLNQNVPVEY